MQVGPIDERLGERGRRRADVDDDRLAVRHERSGGGCDLRLLVGVTRHHLLERPLTASTVERHRAAVHAERELTLLENLQVVANRHGGHAEPVGEVAHTDEPALLQQLLDQDQSHLRGEMRVRKPPQTCHRFRYLSLTLSWLSIRNR